jgi:hypothetical protein
MSHFDPQTPEEIAARLSDIRTKLATRTNRDGTPKAGFKANVEAVKAEIARLEALQGDAA